MTFRENARSETEDPEKKKTAREDERGRSHVVLGHSQCSRQCSRQQLEEEFWREDTRGINTQTKLRKAVEKTFGNHRSRMIVFCCKSDCAILWHVM